MLRMTTCWASNQQAQDLEELGFVERQLLPVVLSFSLYDPWRKDSLSVLDLDLRPKMTSTIWSPDAKT